MNPDLSQKFIDKLCGKMALPFFGVVTILQGG